MDPESLTEFDTATWDMRAAMEHALEDMWRQGADMEMVEYPEDVRVGIDGPLKLVHTSEGPLTTRVLFECAAVLDELFQFEGAFIRKADPALREFVTLCASYMAIPHPVRRPMRWQGLIKFHRPPGCW
ncbi:hypothetical protein [Streptomyces sp. NPDC058451]|uniref:hypothetical protein n=1 Tax=Streptomyces sp. NPDC058451 TaxID=3346506 RepID=UPI00365981E6